MNAPLARLYVAAHPPADDAPVYHDLPAEARFADVTTDLDAFEDQVPQEAVEDDEPVWRWALAVIAVGCAVVFVAVPLVRWWW